LLKGPSLPEALDCLIWGLRILDTAGHVLLSVLVVLLVTVWLLEDIVAMEMRRHASPRWSVERAVLSLYWLVSGYALRAWRRLRSRWWGRRGCWCTATAWSRRSR
jgi:hypothetical protein